MVITAVMGRQVTETGGVAKQGYSSYEMQESSIQSSVVRRNKDILEKLVEPPMATKGQEYGQQGTVTNATAIKLMDSRTTITERNLHRQQYGNNVNDQECKLMDINHT
ncbi:unnamed protein product [Cylicocyclus nassatus]|uniref:Uncharacterized protein n=1 Tax=Cylicocyclus nassatus TaxID=53992 RepID=A0AA36MCK2_CYLNA|nr:unnamed protein product [Cylicocyclus nassatus]